MAQSNGHSEGALADRAPEHFIQVGGAETDDGRGRGGSGEESASFHWSFGGDVFLLGRARNSGPRCQVTGDEAAGAHLGGLLRLAEGGRDRGAEAERHQDLQLGG